MYILIDSRFYFHSAKQTNMFKIISITILAYIFYRLVKPKALNEPLPDKGKDNTRENKNDEGEFIDYEEIDD